MLTASQSIVFVIIIHAFLLWRLIAADLWDFFPLPSNYLIHLSNPFALCIIFQFRKVYQYKASFAEGTFIVKKPQWHSQSPYCDQDILIQQRMSEKHKS